MGIELTPEAMKGIGPATQPASRPLNEDVECVGPPLWSADDNDRQAGAWASENFEGRYWVQEPGETSPGPQHGLEPMSDVTGSIPLGEDPGRIGADMNARGQQVQGMPPAVDNR